MNSLIAQIQNAIAADKTTLQQLNVERNEVLRVLNKARFVDASDLHRIEGKFNVKIENKINEIQQMEKHLGELDTP